MAATDTQKDLVLPPGRSVIIQNDKGLLDVWVGPTRVVSSSSNEVALAWNHSSKLFDRHEADPTKAIRSLVQVARDEYVVLEGLPSNLKTGDPEHPPTGGQTRSAEVDVSQRTTLHGPRVFALWPRQNATVIPGHRLDYDQYLLVRVYDVDQAKAKLDPALAALDIKVDELTMGDLFIIDGTQTSFYMPGAGIEVVRDETGSYVRQAVTVEPLEYAYLRDLDGSKDYLRGPRVVFPKPTQTFVTREIGDGVIVRKFRALELTETSAIYVKVSQEYVEESGPDAGKKRGVGDELFLIGKDHPLYYPRKEHMLIRQGDSEIHHAIAIPRGSGYYVRNKVTWEDAAGKTHIDGEVELIEGPKTLLIDPRHQTLTKRALPLDLVALMYPGNQEAMTVNQQRLRENAAKAGIQTLPTTEAYTLSAGAPRAMAARGGYGPAAAGRQFEGDVSTRPVAYAKQHAIDLGSSKYDGAPRMAIRPGYAVLLTNSVGQRRVVKGGEVALLQYDEFPTVLSLSTGTPKSGTERKKEVYLRTVTKITDEIKLDTSDGVQLTLGLSYRIRFQGDPTKWFDIEDLVGFMTDNLRSIVHHEVAKRGIREFHADFAAIIRTIVLGEPQDGERPGRTFEENGMHIYDVDVLSLKFADRNLELLFTDAAKAAFQNELKIAAETRGLDLAAKLSAVGIAKAKLAAEGAEELAMHNKVKAEADAASAIAAINGEAMTADQRHKAALAVLAASNREIQADVANEQVRADAEFANNKRSHDETIRLRVSKTEAIVARMNAAQPKLIDAMDRLADTTTLAALAEHFNVLSLLTRTPVTGVLGKVFGGTRIGRLLEKGTGNGASNGHAEA